MRRLLVIGVGSGDPEQVTAEAARALNEVDVFFVMDKGESTGDLVALRRAICDRYITGRAYRTIEIADPGRDRSAHAYREAVGSWQHERVLRYERLLLDELGEDQCGAVLVWGDPCLYDGTLRVVQQLGERGRVELDHRVIPGISSVQALAARHRVTLTRVGGQVLVTTGRRLAEAGLPDGVDDVVVMLDGACSFRRVPPAGIDIYWGAYLGTPDEILVAGPLADRADEIVRVRAEARSRKGWMFDVYLLRRRQS